MWTPCLVAIPPKAQQTNIEAAAIPLRNCESNRKQNKAVTSKLTDQCSERDLPSWSEKVKHHNKIFLYKYYFLDVWDMVTKDNHNVDLDVWADAWQLHEAKVSESRPSTPQFSEVCIQYSDVLHLWGCAALQWMPQHSELCIPSAIVLHTGSSSIVAPTRVLDLITQGPILSNLKSSFLSIPTSNTSTNSETFTYLPSHSPNNCQSKPS